MSRRWPWLFFPHVVALCAVALFNVAVVRSTVMRAAPPAAMEHCAQVTGMAGMGSSHTSKPGKADAAKAACAFCSAAAHAPTPVTLCAPVAPTFVAWSPPRVWSAHGPRGPPAVQPMARGPPPLSTMI